MKLLEKLIVIQTETTKQTKLLKTEARFPLYRASHGGIKEKEKQL